MFKANPFGHIFFGHLSVFVCEITFIAHKNYRHILWPTNLIKLLNHKINFYFIGVYLKVSPDFFNFFKTCLNDIECTQIINTLRKDVKHFNLSKKVCNLFLTIPIDQHKGVCIGYGKTSHGWKLHVSFSVEKVDLILDLAKNQLICKIK